MSNKSEDEKEERPLVAKTPADLQRLKLMKLMKHPEKPVVIPERPKPKATVSVPEFVRNVMGSSAGAGSGEFHVYRHLRRKEYARQKFIQEKSQKEILDEEYHEKLEENKRKAEEMTAKKRAKRLKKKQNIKLKKKLGSKPDDNKISNSTSESDAEMESSDDKKNCSEDSSDIQDKNNIVQYSKDSCKIMDNENRQNNDMNTLTESVSLKKTTEINNEMHKDSKK